MLLMTDARPVQRILELVGLLQCKNEAGFLLS